MLKCRCGGEFKSIDKVVDSGVRNRGHIVFQDVRIKPGYATRKCTNCGSLREQRLRTAKPKSKSN